MVEGKLIKHDQYIEELKDLITHNYDSIDTHIFLSDKKRIVGEIDLIAEREGRRDVFEVKCSYRMYKARQQLKKIKRYTKSPIDNYFFYCGSSHLLHLVSV